MIERERIIEGIEALNEANFEIDKLVYNNKINLSVLIELFVSSVEYAVDFLGKEKLLPLVVIDVYNEISDFILVQREEKKKEEDLVKIMLPEVIEVKEFVIPERKKKLSKIKPRTGARAIVRRMLRGGYKRNQIKDVVVNHYINEFGRNERWARARFACIYYEMSLEMGLEISKDDV